MYKQLTREQRYTLDLLLKKNVKKITIAELLSVSPSTITREIKRNSGKRGYSCLLAQEMAEERKERLPGNRSIKEELWSRVEKMLRDDWSPMQIRGVLAKEGIRISHQSIYTHIEKDKRNGGDLYTHCRHKLKHRKRPVGATASCRNIPDRVSISERPIEADGTRFGDWELDTIVGKDNKGAIVTLTERKTNFVLMERLKLGKNAEEAAKVIVRLLLPCGRLSEILSKELETLSYKLTTVSSVQACLTNSTSRIPTSMSTSTAFSKRPATTATSAY